MSKVTEQTRVEEAATYELRRDMDKAFHRWMMFARASRAKFNMTIVTSEGNIHTIQGEGVNPEKMQGGKDAVSTLREMIAIALHNDWGGVVDVLRQEMRHQEWKRDRDVTVTPDWEGKRKEKAPPWEVVSGYSRSDEEQDDD